MCLQILQLKENKQLLNNKPKPILLKEAAPTQPRPPHPQIQQLVILQRIQSVPNTISILQTALPLKLVKKKTSNKLQSKTRLH